MGLTYGYHAEAINSIRDATHALAIEKGWHDGGRALPTPELIAVEIANIHAELSECLEAIRGNSVDFVAPDGKPEGPTSELADVILRALNLCGWLKVDIGDVLVMKFAYNERRPYRHGGKAF